MPGPESVVVLASYGFSGRPSPVFCHISLWRIACLLFPAWGPPPGLSLPAYRPANVHADSLIATCMTSRLDRLTAGDSSKRPCVHVYHLVHLCWEI